VAEPLTISPGEPANKGLDYARLRDEGVALLQRLAGQVWTDYNEHDPGVTTLEQLCYALTELSYRAEFPLKDLLIDPLSGKIDTRRQALFIPRRILTSNATTEQDYRKLIVDRVPGVANAWLKPHRPPDPSKFVNGLYDIALYTPGADPCVCEGELAPRAIRTRTRRVYCRHRSLCEDVHAIYILKPLRATVFADVTIKGASAPEATLAKLFFNLGNFLAPELRRSSLKTMLDLGLSADEIFNGPLLKNGFINDAQLQPKATDIPVREIVRVMVRSPGVARVLGVWVRTGDGGAIYRGDDSIPVPEKSILQLDTRTDRQSGGFTIRLFKDGIEYEPDPLQVRRELEKLWADYRSTYRLGPQYKQLFAVPQGSKRDLSPYYSLQNQYPDVYGISDNGLPEAAPVARKGQAKQLKGYLLVFEQLLADFFAQLAHVKDLYSTETGLRHTYFYQYLTESVPNVAPLLKEDYARELPRIVHGQDPFNERRNRFLDFLLALYAERLDVSSVTGAASDAQSVDSEGERLTRAKLALLHYMVASTHDRGRGFDYLASDSPTNIAGMEIKSRIQLGMDAFDHRPLVDFLDESSVELASSDASSSFAKPLGRHADHIEESFAPVISYADAQAGADATGEQPAPRAASLNGLAVSEEFLLIAADMKNYRVGSFPGESSVAVVCKSPVEERWRLVGKYPDLETALTAARATYALAHKLQRHSRQLYIVEHTLLRFGRSGHDELHDEDRADAERDPRHAREGVETAAQKFVYGFTITAVISTPQGAEGDASYRTFVREAIRQNVPAHVIADYCFLNLRQMRQFELLYWDWRRALRRGQPRRNVIDASARLRQYLRQCRGRASAHDV
jgi:hypothetical protein